jgi:hypothetical protein
MNCDHISKVVKDGYNLIDGQMHSTVLLWGCTKCDATSTEPLYDITAAFVSKEPCKEDCNCFGCKARGLQMNTGDAGRPVSKKQWDGRLKFYKDARNQGIQPAGTHPEQVKAAYKASETLGKAYDAGTMGVRADKVTKSVAAVMKETGAA